MYRLNFHRWVMLILALNIFSIKIIGKVYYVSPSGNDSYQGTITNPWATWQKAFNSAYPGDTVYFRGGVYYSGTSVDCIPPDIGRSGTVDKPICYFNYPGEVPILDGKNRISPSAGVMFQGASYIHLKGLTVRNNYQILNNYGDASGFIFVRGTGITIENCTSYNNGRRGFYLHEIKEVLIVNCDAYDNCDALDTSYPGGGADGFIIWYDNSLDDLTNHAVVRNCRSWHNSDDGFDTNSEGLVEYDNCWSFNNGYLSGDGNGFKFGLVDISTTNLTRKITNCISAFNLRNGYDENNNGGYACMNVLVYNNISYKNSGVGYLTYPGCGGGKKDNLYSNNIAYQDTRSMPLDYQQMKDSYNSWNTPPGVTISDADFITVADGVNKLMAPRQSDGSLPDLGGFLHLAEGSDLINKGINIGLPYTGSAPDLGAFEYGGQVVTNYPPVVSNIPGQTINEGGNFTAIQLDNYVSDPDNADNQITWTYSGNINLNVAINASTRIATITVKNAGWNGSEVLTFTATDPGGLKGSKQATFIVNAVNNPPVVSNIPGQTINEGENFTAIQLDNYVSDPDNADNQITWTYSGNINLNIAINASTRIATITVKNAGWNGSEVITFTATDPGGLKSSKQATFIVNAVNNPPVVSNIPGQTISEGGNFTAISLDNYVSDPDNADNQITWTYSGNINLNIAINASTRIATITVKNAGWNGSEVLTFTATDPGGLKSSKQATFIVNAVNNPPVVSNIPGQTINEGGNFTAISLDNYVSDPDNADNQITWTYSGNINLNIAINTTTRIATVTVKNSGWNGSEVITFTATDPGGLKSSKQATFIVNAVNNPPVVSNIPGQTISEGGNFTAIPLDNYVSDPDNADNQITWTYSGNINLNIAINASTRIATITVKNSGWSGNEPVIIKATDPEGLYGSIEVIFNVLAINNPPVINNQDFVIDKRKLSNNYIGRIIANDPDAGQNLNFTIQSGNTTGVFALNNINGDLSISSGIDINQLLSEYNLTVMVEDDGNVIKNSTANLKISFVMNHVIYYIDPSNTNDQNRDGSIGHPFNSWKEVAWIDSSTYLQKKGTTSNESKINITVSNITIGSYGEGEKPIIKSSATDFAIRAFEKINLNINDLHIIASDAVSCIYILGASEGCKIDNCRLEGAQNGARVVDSKNITLCYNTFVNCTEAIYSLAENNQIFYNIFKNNQIGINASSYLANTNVFNNVFYNNLIGVSVNYSSLTLYNNIFYLGKEGDLAITTNMDNMISNNNIFYPEFNGFISIANRNFNTLNEYQKSLSIDLNSFNLDPKFKDAYNENFTVEPNSPAIDAGITVGLNLDFYGEMVPKGNKPDIGLSECSASITNNDLSVNENDQDDLIVYPNPSDGAFNVSFKGEGQQISKLTITDISGKMLYEETDFEDDINYFKHFDLSNLYKGMYLLNVIMEGKIYNQRIIIK